MHAEMLPKLRGFQGQELSDSTSGGGGFPWIVRVDVGVHTGGLDDAELGDGGWPAGERKYFLNEIEIVPTYYLSAKFEHKLDFVALYARKMAITCAEVAGFDATLLGEVVLPAQAQAQVQAAEAAEEPVEGGDEAESQPMEQPDD